MLSGLGPATGPVLGPDDRGEKDMRGVVDPPASQQMFGVAHNAGGECQLHVLSIPPAFSDGIAAVLRSCEVPPAFDLYL